MIQAKKTGTYEWSESTVNIQLGCEHNCRYCYARANALRFKRIADADQWSKPVINQKAVDKNYGGRKGVIMFPSTHDITINNVIECGYVLENLLKNGNEILIVSKPHFDCIELLCQWFIDYKDQVQFRFTIGSTNDEILKFWEPGAPGFEERLNCLKYTHFKGYKTSVSAEPFLDSHLDYLYLRCFPYITDSFWIGLLRHFNRRVDLSEFSDEQIKRYVEPLKTIQMKEIVLEIHEKFKKSPFVKFKDSIREIVES